MPDGSEVNLFEYAGITLKERKNGRRALVGTALHKGVEAILRGKQEQKHVHDTEAYEQAVASIAAKWDECEPDENIKDTDAANKILANILPVATKRARELDPVHIEEKLVTQIGSVRLEGTPDVISKHLGYLSGHDWKTGKTPSPKPYPSQVGGYTRLALDNGIELEDFSTEMIQQLKQKQPVLKTTNYDVIETLKFADATIERFSNNVDAFLQTGDPNSFDHNPSANICGPQFCRLWGTDGCTVYDKNKENKNA